MKKKGIALILIAAAVALAAAGWFFLPEEVIIQVNALGQPSNTAPKLLAVLIPFVISALSAYLYGFGDARRQSRNLLLTAVGYLIAVITFVFNR